MINFLTSATQAEQELSESLTKTISGLFAIMGISFVFGILILICIVALITWVVKKVWYAGSDREYKRQQREWKQQQKEWEKWKKRQDKAEKEAFQKSGVPSSPGNRPEWEKKIAANPDWLWNDETKLWEHKSHWDKK